MKTFTIEDIRSWKPCYDPEEKLPEDWSGNVIDILNLTNTSTGDKLWVIMRKDLVSEKLMRLFAVWCARQVQHLMKDHKSIEALSVAERFANGEATKEELIVACNVARDAARDAARDVARDAALEAALEAAAYASLGAARTAAWSAARTAQEKKLKEMLIEGVETGDVVLDAEGVE